MSHSRLSAAVFLSFVFLSGCSARTLRPMTHQKKSGPAVRRTTLRKTETRPISPLTLTKLNNADLRLSNGERVRFSNGIGSPHGGRSAISNIAFGDLSGNGVQDAAVVITSSFGGTGSFIDLAAVMNRGGNPDNVATTPIGDRLEINAVRIRNRVIELDVMAHQKGDPLCCPSFQETMGFRLEHGMLVQVEGKRDYDYAPPR